MRPFLILAVGGLCLVSAGAAQAQSREKLYIEVKPRSWLDPGKGPEVGASHNYVSDTQYGSSVGGARFTNYGHLPDRFSSGRPIKVDIVAPAFLTR